MDFRWKVPLSLKGKTNVELKHWGPSGTLLWLGQQIRVWEWIQALPGSDLWRARAVTIYMWLEVTHWITWPYSFYFDPGAQSMAQSPSELVINSMIISKSNYQEAKNWWGLGGKGCPLTRSYTFKSPSRQFSGANHCPCIYMWLMSSEKPFWMFRDPFHLHTIRIRMKCAD